MELWHNPRCTKSRQTKALLDERGLDFAVRLYLEAPPTAAELERVLDLLGMEPWDIARLKEGLAKELDLKAWPKERARWIEVLTTHPKLIERPILITATGAAIGRPPDNVLPLLG